MCIPRILQAQIEAKIAQQKVILLYGTGRTGKTTIIERCTFLHFLNLTSSIIKII